MLRCSSLAPAKLGVIIISILVMTSLPATDWPCPPFLQQRISMKHLKALHQDMEEKSHLYSPRLSEKEYQQFAVQHRHLNRYSDILPYEPSRVKLNRVPDYINASHLNLRGWHHVEHPSVRYIAAQAPVKAAMADWWEMVWQEGVYILVTLVGNDQRGKWDQYWRDEGTWNLGSLQVTLLEEKFLIEGVVIQRTFKLENGSEHRIISQYHYLSWPDYGVPTDLNHFKQFHGIVNSDPNFHSTPPIVHCSAGVGRTGTFIVVDTVLRLLQSKAAISNIDSNWIPDLILHYRQQRCYIVQTWVIHGRLTVF